MLGESTGSGFILCLPAPSICTFKGLRSYFYTNFGYCLDLQMHLAILAWTLLLAANGALGDGFLFPTSQHSLSIRGGDSMTVSWKTSLEISTLYLYCDDSSDGK